MKKIETTSTVYDLIDLFSDSKAKAAINNALTEDIHINYSSHYQNGKVFSGETSFLKVTPVRPIGTQMFAVRNFSTTFAPVNRSNKVLDEENFKKKSAKFLDFLDKAEEVDAEVRQEDLGFSADNIDISFDHTSKPDGRRDAAQALTETRPSDAF